MKNFNYLLMATLFQFIFASASYAGFFADFYKGATSDKHGRMLKDIHNFDLYQLEKTHNFIQTLFPTEAQGVDPLTPAISKEEAELFRKDPYLIDRVFDSFKVMANFYGFYIIPDAQENYIVPASDFWEKSYYWTQVNVHNLHRITRILSSLKLLGLPGVSKEFYKALVNSISHQTVGDQFWEQWKGASGS